MPGLKKILIANRGEIACRIQRTAQALGYRTVAVFSDADADALHVQMADEAVNIGPATVQQSYLNIPAILEAARRTGADAIHPGYGFLSENAAFARACGDAGITFIGPTPQQLETFGDKTAAKRLANQTNVPTVPGTEHGIAEAAKVKAQAKRIGYPIIIKASFGGGGRGMRVVRSEAELLDKLHEAQREAGAAFGRAEVFVEKYIARAKHIEVQ